MCVYASKTRFMKLPLDFAQQAGGALARIESTEEQAFIVSICPSNKKAEYWIAGSDRVTEGKWVFGDSTKMTFFDWAKNEPSNSDQIEHHASINGHNAYKWNDVNSKWKIGLIVEWDY